MFTSGGYNMNFNFNIGNKLKKLAFTLAEVLLAITIVGVIAGLVLPSTISRAQNRGFESAFKRNLNAIEDAVNTLIVSENKDFFKTEMYLDSTPANYDDSSGKFLKTYFKVSRYCGGGEDARACFADKYYRYSGNIRIEHTQSLPGACAKLKNGASICITPQIGDVVPIVGIIDVNGEKGPNILNRDLFIFRLKKKTRSDKDKTLTAVGVTTETLDLDDDTSLENPCEDPTSVACCNSKTDVKPGDVCCEKYQWFRADHPTACESEVEDPCVPNKKTKGCCAKGIVPENKEYCCNQSEYVSAEICGGGWDYSWSCDCIGSGSGRNCSCNVKRTKAGTNLEVSGTDMAPYKFGGMLCSQGNEGVNCSQFSNKRSGEQLLSGSVSEGYQGTFFVKDCVMSVNGKDLPMATNCSGTFDYASYF